ncbi:Gfo/Idh/MocA family oxidoreductase [Algoriphagus aestuariicola]|uniref:Gfo/Idh/MocA family oxidoreductase n=1 Tax=Algoriphagus aestuariicola TaxID=1852016 RepID=A0ABS3BNY8_9BACT|nr:Gfo/Idh/MocA family oxidoreductase [Algoriphagus aestuariicola]MBN7800737.1 Gfo/Idh/MocA family oxidoreductase [Algoriphagus aestuariicola]
MSNSFNRRNFLKTMGTGTLGLGAVGPAFSFNILSSYPLKNRYRVAVIGVNSRGSQHIQALSKIPNVEIAYICDVDSNALAKGVELAVKSGSTSPPARVKDFRKALEDTKLDAVSIAMPDHWHTPAALLALQAGKHVYIEKPGSHNPAEAELLVEATKKYGKVVQMGNQRRSWPRVQEAMKELHSGTIGRVYYARAWYTNSRKSIGYGNAASVPEWLDFELWQGPAPRAEFKDNLIHYNWHWFWNWGTGEIVNNGVHFLDLARWGLQVDYPEKVYSSGGRYHFQDDWQTPDTQVASYDFGDRKSILWEGRSCNVRDINGMGSGVSFHGENGTLELLNNSYKIFDNTNKLIKSADPTSNIVVNQQGAGFDMDVDHFKNFINAIDNGESLISPYPEIKKSVLLCHLGNISYRTGRALEIDPNSGRILNDNAAMKLWGREYERGWEPKL